MKKWLYGFGGFFVLAFAAILVLPSIINVDQYRPQILQKANESLQGQLDLGQFELSLLGKIKIRIAGLKLADQNKKEIIAVNEASVVIPWTSLLSGEPLMTIEMNEPNIQLIKEADGKTNLAKTLKLTETPSTANAVTPTDSKKSEMPSFLTKARLGLYLRNAKLSYQDQVKASVTALDRFNIKVKELSLTHPTEIEINGDLLANEAKSFRISGPFQISAKIKPEINKSVLDAALVELMMNFDDLDINAADVFHKSKGVPAKITGQFGFSANQINVDTLKIQFHNLAIKVEGKLSEQADSKLKIESNEVDLSAWNDLFNGALKNPNLSGKLKLGMNAWGPTAAMKYEGAVNLSQFKIKAENLKQPMILDSEIVIKTDQIEKFLFSLNATANDLKISGSLLSFTQPKLSLNVDSKQMDLDQLIKFEPVKVDESKDTQVTDAKDATKTPTKDFDAMIEPMRTNEMLIAMQANVKINMGLIKFMDVEFKNNTSSMNMKDLNATIESLSSQLWNGSIQAKAGMNLKPKAPTYHFKAIAQNVDLQKGFESQFKLFHNTIVGKLSATVDGSGSSFNPEAAKKNLNMKGNAKINDALFQLIDVVKVAQDALNENLGKVADKIPALKSRTVQKLANSKNKFEYVSSQFTMKDGVFSSPDFVAKAYPNKGLDLKGSTEVGMLDKHLKTQWSLLDPYNITKGEDVSATVAGVEIKRILAEKGKPLEIPIEVECLYTAPCTKYNRLVSHFTDIALKNSTGAAKEKVTAKAVDAANKVVDKIKAPEPVKNLIKGLFGK